MRAMSVAVMTVVLLSLCRQTEGQPCRICRPDAAVESCEGMTPPKDVTIDGSVCSVIENKHQDYHKKLCEKFPPPKGYVYQCTTPGTTNTFSCQSSCGPRLEDVGKGMNLNLLQGGGLLGNFNNRPPQRGTGLFDFNNFNTDNGRGSTNFGQFATLNSLNNFNNFNNNNNNNNGNSGNNGNNNNVNGNNNNVNGNNLSQFKNNKNNNFNTFNTQQGANGDGKFQSNVLTEGRSSNTVGGARITGSSLSSRGGGQKGSSSSGSSAFSHSRSRYNDADEIGHSTSNGDFLNTDLAGQDGGSSLPQSRNSFGEDVSYAKDDRVGSLSDNNKGNNRLPDAEINSPERNDVDIHGSVRDIDGRNDNSLNYAGASKAGLGTLNPTGFRKPTTNKDFMKPSKPGFLNTNGAGATISRDLNPNFGLGPLVNNYNDFNKRYNSFNDDFQDNFDNLGSQATISQDVSANRNLFSYMPQQSNLVASAAGPADYSNRGTDFKSEMQRNIEDGGIVGTADRIAENIATADSVPISGGIRGSGGGSHNPPPTVKSPSNPVPQSDSSVPVRPPRPPSNLGNDQPPPIGTLFIQNYPPPQGGVNQFSSFPRAFPPNNLLNNNGLNVKQNKIYPPTNEPSVSNFVGGNDFNGDPPLKSYSVEVDIPLNAQRGNPLIKDTGNSGPDKDYLKNVVSESTFPKGGKTYLPGSNPNVDNSVKKELFTTDASSENDPADLQTAPNVDTSAEARPKSESPAEPGPDYQNTYPIDLSGDEVYPGGQPPQNPERYIDASGSYPDQPPPPQLPPQGYPTADQFVGEDSSSQLEAASPQEVPIASANLPPPENYPDPDLSPVGLSPGDSEEEQPDLNQDPNPHTTSSPYSPTPTDPQVSSGQVTMTTGTPQGESSEESGDGGDQYPPVNTGHRRNENQAAVGQGPPPRSSNVAANASPREDKRPPSPRPIYSSTPSPTGNSEEEEAEGDDGTSSSSSSSNQHPNIPPEAFQNPFRNPNSPYGKRTDQFESNPAFVGTHLFSEGFLDSPEGVRPAAVHRPRGPDAVDVDGYQIFPGFQQFEKTGATDALGIDSDEVDDDSDNIFSLFLQHNNQPAQRGRSDGGGQPSRQPSRQPFGFHARNPAGSSGQNPGRRADGYQPLSNSARGGQNHNADGPVFSGYFFPGESQPDRATNTGGLFPHQRTNNQPSPTSHAGTSAGNNQNRYRSFHSDPSPQVSGASRSGSSSGRGNVHGSANGGYRTSPASSTSTSAGDKRRRGFVGFGSPGATDRFGFPGSFGSFNNQGFSSNNFNNKHLSDDLFHGPSATSDTSSEEQS